MKLSEWHKSKSVVRIRFQVLVRFLPSHRQELTAGSLQVSFIETFGTQTDKLQNKWYGHVDVGQDECWLCEDVVDIEDLGKVLEAKKDEKKEEEFVPYYVLG